MDDTALHECTSMIVFFTDRKNFELGGRFLSLRCNTVPVLAISSNSHIVLDAFFNITRRVVDISEVLNLVVGTDRPTLI